MFDPPELPAVEYSGELRRVLSLPETEIPIPEIVKALSEILGSGMLRPIQAQALLELCDCHGLLAPISVGGGKTLISYLAPRMADAKYPLLLVPAKLREKTYRDFRKLGRTWQTTNPPCVLSYEMLSRHQYRDYLTDHRPDLIIADEAHRLKNPKTACTRRVGRYMHDHPDTVFVALSGTMTKRSIMDFAHLADWALGEGSPLPRNRYDLEQWAQAIDEENQWSKCRRAPGALLALGDPDVRKGFQRRLISTPGVVASTGSGVDASLVITRWSVDMHPEVKKALQHLYRYWETPDGKPMVSAVDIWRHGREIAQGFWYRWDPEPPADWLESRRVWAAYAREILSRSRTLDTEYQVALRHKDSPEYRDWYAIKDSYTPNVVVEWITNQYVCEAMDWAQDNAGIVWVEHRVVGEELHNMGLDYYASYGMCGDKVIDDAKGSICASIAANSEGRNLQRYHKNLILSPPTTGDQWEQLLGRTHREGQPADEVSVEVHLGCPQSADGFWQAVSDAEYQKGVLGADQKLLLADIGVG